MKRIEDILASCIDDIKAGKATLDDCLKQHSAVRKQLEPMLRTALSIDEPRDIKPSSAFKLRARVNLMERIYTEGPARRWWQFGSGTRAGTPVFAGAFRAIAIIVVVLLAVSILGGGTAYASQDSLPGDTLYPVKLGTEQARRIFTFNDTSRINLELGFAETRLEELEALVEISPDDMSTAAEGYENNISNALQKAERLSAAGTSANISEKVASAISEHLATLDRIEEKTPENNRNTIRQMRQVINEGQVNSLRILARENPVRAAEINLNNMENQLERTRDKAGTAGAEDLEANLSQFESLSKLGNDISQAARNSGNNTGIIDELNTRNTARNLEILDEIYEKVPEQGRAAVERVMRRIVESHEQAVTSLEESGAPANVTEQLRLSDEITERVRGRASDNATGSSQRPDNAGSREPEDVSDNTAEKPDVPTESPNRSNNGNTSDTRGQSSGNSSSGRR